MRQLVIGLGEAGGPLREIIGCDGWDSREAPDRECPRGSDVLHVAFPYRADFVEYVKWYQARQTKDCLVIIHSTVPIGTTAKLANAVHSPIQGQHHNMKEALLKIPKWVGGMRAPEAAGILGQAGFTCRVFPAPEHTEALKLICLAKYGVDIAMAKLAREIGNDVGLSQDAIRYWDLNYNQHVPPRLRRALIDPQPGPIGGHCVVPGVRLLDQSHPRDILKGVLAYG